MYDVRRYRSDRLNNSAIFRFKKVHSDTEASDASTISSAFTTEILGIIFQCACARKQPKEIVPSHVCRLWRAIALADGELRTTFPSCGIHDSQVQRCAATSKGPELFRVQ